MMKDQIQVAIIGCGDIAGGYDERKTGEGIFSHAGAYRVFENVKISAAFDVDSAQLRAFCAYWKIPECTSLAQLLTGRYDVVSVCTPDHTHEHIINAILASGCAKYIWAEKPLATSYVGAKEVLRKAKMKNVGLWLSNQRRWEPCHQKIRQKIQQKCLGELVHVVGYYVKGIVHIGCTMVDTLRFFFGEISWVQAIAPFDRGTYGADFSLCGMLGFKDGGVATLVGCDANDYTYSIFEIDAVGTEGRIKLEENGDSIRIYRPGAFGHYSGFQELHQQSKSKTEMNMSMKYGLELLLDDLYVNNYSRHFAEEGLVDLQVVDALCQSAKDNGRKVVLCQ